MKKIHISALPTPNWPKFGCKMSEVYMYQSCKIHRNLLNRVRYFPHQFGDQGISKAFFYANF